MRLILRPVGSSLDRSHTGRRLRDRSRADLRHGLRFACRFGKTLLLRPAGRPAGAAPARAGGGGGVGGGVLRAPARSAPGGAAPTRAQQRAGVAPGGAAPAGAAVVDVAAGGVDERVRDEALVGGPARRRADFLVGLGGADLIDALGEGA